MTNTTTTAIDALGQRAADIAMRAAADYCRANRLAVDVDALVASLKATIPGATLALLDEAREGFALHMHDAAMASFAAGVRLAGIAAVKACGFAAVSA